MNTRPILSATKIILIRFFSKIFSQFFFCYFSHNHEKTTRYKYKFLSNICKTRTYRYPIGVLY